MRAQWCYFPDFSALLLLLLHFTLLSWQLCVCAVRGVETRWWPGWRPLSLAAVCGHGVEPLWNQPVLPVSHAPFLKKGLNYFIAFFTNLFCSKHTALQYPSMFKPYWILMKVDGTQHYYICSEASCDFTHWNGRVSIYMLCVKHCLRCTPLWYFYYVQWPLSSDISRDFLFLFDLFV